MFKYEFGAKSFKDKNQIKNFCSSVLQSVTSQSPKKLKGEAAETVIALATNPQSAYADLAGHIKNVYVARDVQFTTRHFELELKDGKYIIISHKKFLPAKSAALGKGLVDKVIDAFRMAVREQTMDYKLSRKTRGGYWVSDLSKTVITEMHEAQVDHLFPNTFRKLVYDFMVLERIEVGDVPLVERNETYSIGNETGLKDRWEGYHAKHAKLRILTSEENRLDGVKNWRKDVVWERFAGLLQTASNDPTPQNTP
jgi:hypothetical protein